VEPTTVTFAATLEKETKNFRKLRLVGGCMGTIYLPKGEPLPQRIVIEVK